MVSVKIASQDEKQIGNRWNGQYEPAGRVILGPPCAQYEEAACQESKTAQSKDAPTQAQAIQCRTARRE
jgi:hypothetical protein